MFKKENRLRSNEVAQIIKKSQFIGGAGLSARFVPSSEARFAVVASKKVAKSAVVRHRIRRQVFHGIRECDGLELGACVVVFVSKQYLSMTKEDRRASISKLLLQIKTKSTTLEPTGN